MIASNILKLANLDKNISMGFGFVFFRFAGSRRRCKDILVLELRVLAVLMVAAMALVMVAAMAVELKAAMAVAAAVASSIRLDFLLFSRCRETCISHF